VISAREGTPEARSYRQTWPVRSFVLAVTGRDRPGIVAAVTRVLLEHDVNLEDAEMAILRGHFAVMLVLAAPDAVDEAALRADLERVRDDVPLETVSLAEVPALGAEPAEPSHAISVYGGDHPGIVHGVAAALADAGVNVVDLSTRVAGELYAMLLEVALPPSLAEPGLEELLARVAAEQGVDVSVRAVGGDVL
jgi:glycine cleavage system transcriptional repressor